MPDLPTSWPGRYGAFVLLTVIEMISVRIRPTVEGAAAGYEAEDIATSVGMGLGSPAFAPVRTGLLLLLLPPRPPRRPRPLGLPRRLVHHASRGGCLDRDFGGILIVRDRLFGSFVAETEQPVYGLTKNINTFNPVKVATHEYVAIVKDTKTAGS